MTANATSIDETQTSIETGDAPSVQIGLFLVQDLASTALTGDQDDDVGASDVDFNEIEGAAFDCLEALLTPIKPYRGRRREAERFRELHRVALMLAEGWIAWEHYQVSRTRTEVAGIMALTPRQLRTRELLLQRAIDYFELGWEVAPAFRGRPPGRGWKPATGGRPGTLRHVAARLGVSERMLYRFLHGMEDSIHVDVVDRVLTNAGASTTLRDLYPGWYENP